MYVCVGERWYVSLFESSVHSGWLDAKTHVYNLSMNAHAAVTGRHHLLDARPALPNHPPHHGRGQLHHGRLSCCVDDDTHTLVYDQDQISIHVACVLIVVCVYTDTKTQNKNTRTGFSKKARGMTEGSPPPGPTFGWCMWWWWGWPCAMGGDRGRCCWCCWG